MAARSGQSAERNTLDDLRDWQSHGLPAYAQWNTTHFTPDWHVARLKEGHRIIPSIFLPARDVAERPQAAANQLGRYYPALDEIARLRAPILLRTNNVASGFRLPRWRTPRPWTRVPDDSPLVWRMFNGALDDTPVADDLAPASNWAAEGRALAESPYFRAIIARIPDPPYWIHTENHEVHMTPPVTSDVAAVKLPWPAGPRLVKPDGRRYGPPLRWRSKEEIAKVSIRLAERVAALGPDSDPYAERVAQANRQRDQFAAYYGAMRGALPGAWKTGMRTEAYSSGKEMGYAPPDAVEEEIGPCPDARYVDGAGCQMYIGYYMTADLTDPALAANIDFQREGWEWIEKSNPNAFRTVFIWIDGKKAVAGAQAGKHPVIDPPMWEAVCTWIAWQARTPGRAVLLHHWLVSKRSPEDLFFGDPDEAGPVNESAANREKRLKRTAAAKERQEFLRMNGRPDLVTATEHEYALAAMRSIDPILNTPEIRDFWRRGMTMPASSPGGEVKVRTVCVLLDSEILLYAWTPLNDVGEVSVVIPGIGERTLNFSGARSGYWRIPAAPNAPGSTLRRLSLP